MATTKNYNLIKPLETDYYDIEIQNENMDRIDAALKDAMVCIANETSAREALDAAIESIISTKANKSSTVTVTLSAASWVGTFSPYTYTLAITGVTTTSNQEIVPSLTITAVQLKALQLANIQDGGQSTESITLKAFGNKPTIDLPIRVMKRGDA